MHCLLLIWNLKEQPDTVLERLRRYIATESWARYADKAGLRQKTWFSNPCDRVFGAFYLWETEASMEEEIRTMSRVQAITGCPPSIHRYSVEAIQSGKHGASPLTAEGLAWQMASEPPRTS